MAEVQVLLSTWNGEAWLAELLASLAQQTFVDWELLVRDDGSNDKTVKLLLEWQQLHPDKLVRLDVDGQHLGSTASFSHLVTMSNAPYLMFCDQDDVWFPEKIAVEYGAVKKLSDTHNEQLPLLVHTDLVLVDEHKVLLSNSFWKWRGLNVHQQKQDYLLTNTVTGCAALFNRAAANKAFPVPEGVQYHDRWLGLVCAWFGEVYPLHQAALFYRQHGQNAVGAGLANHQHVSTGSIPERVKNWSIQAEIFLKQFGDELKIKDYRLVEALADLRHLRGWERRKHIVRHQLFKRGVVANLALLWFA
ncbi:MAG: Alpha-L-Rha alpha-1,3-L-rhamnosyltransferase (EC [uncultured Thiotrichaceae bacterium]|uniref:Alpha-L-Rha alpha-1,3-L-rhamnosyltransferase (EC) n=1 Tax=uncultured Thiotrichaceae bacterium TaxID=298394 RepID=A0A6S6T573_9GAMM|nr:MAG: Alpha-L-Rha alpha-1,3-L-rhamnosyltransferase (EC [uncultured Thiotrichaceae bacterium]